MLESVSPCSKQPKNLNAVFDRLRRRMLVAQLVHRGSWAQKHRQRVGARAPATPARPRRARGRAGPHVMLRTRVEFRVEFRVQFGVVRRGRAGPLNRGLTRWSSASPDRCGPDLSRAIWPDSTPRPNVVAGRPPLGRVRTATSKNAPRPAAPGGWRRAVRPRESQVRPQGPSRRRRPADAQASVRPVLALDAVAPRPVALPDAWAGQARTILHGRGGNGRRTVRPQPVREAWSTGAEVAGAPWQTRRPPPREDRPSTAQQDVRSQRTRVGLQPAGGL